MGFLTNYFNIVEGAKEIAVCCPFDHTTTSGIAYKESNPSAHINTIEHLFHCKVCAVGYSEAQFIQQIFNCTYLDAKRIQRCFETNENIFLWDEQTDLTEESKNLALSLGISEAVIEELKIKTTPGTPNFISYPVFMYNQLVDVRKYDPNNRPKVKSRYNCPAGLIIPYDIWRETLPNRVTLICAGEKDMAVARSHGLNAITLTGGEGALPKQSKMFKNRNVVIAYDNDGPGQKGAKALA